jgi:DNA transposition AAA+ family ATPase
VGSYARPAYYSRTQGRSEYESLAIATMGNWLEEFEREMQQAIEETIERVGDRRRTPS